MTDQELSQQILRKIKEKKIKPISKLTFLLKNVTIWFLTITSLTIGALAFAVIIHIVINNDWDVYKNINDSLLTFILLTLPYFWFIFLIFFIATAYYNFSHTKKGYKFPLPTVIFTSIIISIVFGGLLYTFGVGEAIDRALAEKTQHYNKFCNQRPQIWMQPEQGRLAGIVIEIKDQNIFLLNDLTKQQWQVITIQPIQQPIQPGIKIRLFGQQIAPQTFEAVQIMPYDPLLPKNFNELFGQKRIQLYRIYERNNF